MQWVVFILISQLKENHMYSSKDYKNRLNLQSICNYLRYGEAPMKIDDCTLKEREKNISKALINALEIFRDRTISYNWSTIKDDADSRMEVTEDMWHEVMDAISDLSAFEYETGFRAGLTISHKQD